MKLRTSIQGLSTEYNISTRSNNKKDKEVLRALLYQAQFVNKAIQFTFLSRNLLTRWAAFLFAIFNKSYNFSNEIHN